MFVKCSDFGSTKIRCLLSHSLSLLVLIFTLIFSQKEFVSPAASTRSFHPYFIISRFYLGLIFLFACFGRLYMEDMARRYGFYLRVVETISLSHIRYKFISSSHRVIFFLLYRFNAKSGK